MIDAVLYERPRALSLRGSHSISALSKKQLDLTYDGPTEVPIAEGGSYIYHSYAYHSKVDMQPYVTTGSSKLDHAAEPRADPSRWLSRNARAVNFMKASSGQG